MSPVYTLVQRKVSKESTPPMPPPSAVPCATRQTGPVPNSPRKRRGAQTCGTGHLPLRLRCSAASQGPRRQKRKAERQHTTVARLRVAKRIHDVFELAVDLAVDLQSRRGRREAQRPRGSSGPACLSPTALSWGEFGTGPRRRASQGSPRHLYWKTVTPPVGGRHLRVAFSWLLLLAKQKK